jgi:hypothetical protein
MCGCGYFTEKFRIKWELQTVSESLEQREEVQSICNTCSGSWNFSRIYVDGGKGYLTVRKNDRFWNALLKMVISAEHLISLWCVLDYYSGRWLYNFQSVKINLLFFTMFSKDIRQKSKGYLVFQIVIQQNNNLSGCYINIEFFNLNLPKSE